MAEITKITLLKPRLSNFTRLLLNKKVPLLNSIHQMFSFLVQKAQLPLNILLIALVCSNIFVDIFYFPLQLRHNPVDTLRRLGDCICLTSTLAGATRRCSGALPGRGEIYFAWCCYHSLRGAR